MDKTIGEENSLVQYENVIVSFRTMAAKKLVEIAKELGMQYMGSKKVLWDQIIKLGHLHIVRFTHDGQSFILQQKKAAEGSVPTWVTLMPEVVSDVLGIDMQTGAEHGFFGPTNPNNAAGATCSNFCTCLGNEYHGQRLDQKNQQPKSSNDET